MRALQLSGPGEISVRDVAEPAIGSTEVLVKVAGAGLCHSDLHVLHAPIPREQPMTMGHETAGWVERVGTEVDGFANGDPVLVYLVWACGECRACRQGRDNACETAGRLSMPPCPGLGPDGGMAEYIKVDARFLEPLGSLDPVVAGPLADAALTSQHAINGARHRLGAGTTAVVIGVGGLGHMGLQLLAATTESRLVAVDLDQAKLDWAVQHGAAHAFLSDGATADKILDLTNGYGADAIFDFTGVQPTVDLGAATIAPDGAWRFVGLGGGTFQYGAIPWPTIPWGVDLRKSYAGTRADQREVIELAAAGKIHLETTMYDLEDGVSAFHDLEAGKLLGRAILVPNL